MPEWSKGVYLISTVYVRVGSNPTPSTSDPIAQRLERWSYEPKVVGSSPTWNIVIHPSKLVLFHIYFPRLHYVITFVTVAQYGLERLAFNQVAGGSNPPRDNDLSVNK